MGKFKIIICIIGILVIIAGVTVIVRGDSLKNRCTEKTQGVVAELVRQYDSNGEEIYYPVFEYTVDGRTYTKKSKDGQNAPIYSKGEKVDVHYNPNKPEEYVINGNFQLNFTGIALIVAGVAIIGVGLFGKNIMERFN